MAVLGNSWSCDHVPAGAAASSGDTASVCATTCRGRPWPLRLDRLPGVPSPARRGCRLRRRRTPLTATLSRENESSSERLHPCVLSATRAGLGRPPGGPVSAGPARRRRCAGPGASRGRGRVLGRPGSRPWLPPAGGRALPGVTRELAQVFLTRLLPSGRVPSASPGARSGRGGPCPTPPGQQQPAGGGRSRLLRHCLRVQEVFCLRSSNSG